jgi:hypothetical protein
MTSADSNNDNEVSVSIIFYLPLGLSCQEFGKRIRMDATKMYNNDDIVSSKKRSRLQHNFWEFEIKKHHSSEADSAIRQLFKILLPNRLIIVDAVRESSPSVVLGIAVYFAETCNACELEPQELAFLASISAKVVFDVYAIGGDE